jgi:hypothetical protein
VFGQEIFVLINRLINKSTYFYGNAQNQNGKQLVAGLWWLVTGGWSLVSGNWFLVTPRLKVDGRRCKR